MQTFPLLAKSPPHHLYSPVNQDLRQRLLQASRNNTYMIDWTVSQMWAMDNIFNIWTFITRMFWTFIYHPNWSPVRRRLQIDYEMDLAEDLDFELHICGPLLLHGLSLWSV